MWAIWVSTTGQMWIMNSATFYDRTGNLHTKKAPWWWRRSGKFFCAKINWRIFINPWGIYKPLIIQCGPPSDVCWFINPSNYSYLRTINHSEIGAMFTNLAFVNGGLTACINFMDFPESDATGSPTTGSSTASPGPVIHGVQPGKCHGQTTLQVCVDVYIMECIIGISH